MTYEAIITPIVNLRPHSNADRLVLGTASGYQIIVSKETEEGTLGIFFPEGGQLSDEFCKNNNLYSNTEMNKDQKKKGFFGNNGRVRAQRFRGERSEGFWIPLNCFDYIEGSHCFKEGDLITEVLSHPICQKYYTPATIRAKKAQNSKKSKKGFRPNEFPMFKEHYKTRQLRLSIHEIPTNAVIYITEKCHGTSGRTALSYESHTKKNKAYKLLSWVSKLFGLEIKPYKTTHVSGTRRVVLDPKQMTDNIFYDGSTFRSQVHQDLSRCITTEGQTLYYEIVGFLNNEKTIMPSHPIGDKGLKKIYGDKMSYLYGCNPGEHKVLIYRATQTSPNGHEVELSFPQVMELSATYGHQSVPLVTPPFIYDGDKEKLLDLCKTLSEGPSLLDERHIREGIVVRAEAPGLSMNFKYKGFWFCELEGIKKNHDYIDPEEIA